MFYFLFSMILGVCAGSFASMASHRLPLGEDLLVKDSYCPQCKKNIGWHSLVPIFSWVFQRGRCSHCGNKISVRYPIIELSTGLLFVLNLVAWGLGQNLIIMDLLCVCLVIMVVTDLEHYIIPDILQILMLLLGGWFVWHNGFCPTGRIFATLAYAVLLYFTGYVTGKILKKDALGMGDVKFFAVAGMFLGLHILPQFLLFSGLGGLILGALWKKYKKKEVFPFGPALALALYICLLIFYS